jgi:hypothetical protein
MLFLLDMLGIGVLSKGFFRIKHLAAVLALELVSHNLFRDEYLLKGIFLPKRMHSAICSCLH